MPSLASDALQPLARFAHEDAADDALVRGGILPDDEHARAPVEAAAVEDRPPLDAEVVGRIGLRAGVGPQQGREATRVADLELVGHAVSMNLCASSWIEGRARRQARRHSWRS